MRGTTALILERHEGFFVMIGQDAVSPGFLADPLVRKLLVRILREAS